MTRSTSETKPLQRNAKPWWRLASIRTHAIGATACLLVCTAIVHVYRFDSLSNNPGIANGISAEEAIEVLRNAQQWRNVYQEKVLATEQIHASIESLSSWIPDSVDSDELQAQLKIITSTNGVELLSFAYEHSVVGSRVGVAVYTCHLRGNFSSIGRMLDAIAKLDHPISCDRITLGHQAETERPTMSCDAILSLRCPYAAEGTLAYRLLKERPSHGI